MSNEEKEKQARLLCALLGHDQETTEKFIAEMNRPGPKLLPDSIGEPEILDEQEEA